MPGTLEEAAEELRDRFHIPHVNAPENGNSATFDGWRVTGGGPRFIGLIRLYDIDLVPGPDHVRMEPQLLVRELMDHLGDSRASTHVSRSFAEMDAAGHHVDDPALVLAIASRETSPRAAITRSPSYRCSFDAGGLDNVWTVRNQLPLPRAVRRRLRPATDIDYTQFVVESGEVFYHTNERRHGIRPADMRGYDQVIVYAAHVLYARRQLNAQVRAVFGSDSTAAQATLSADADVRRAWTQLSFGRGGGGGLVRALRRARELGSLETIFTDPEMVEADSVKRARVTAADANLTDRFVLGGTAVGATAPTVPGATP